MIAPSHQPYNLTIEQGAKALTWSWIHRRLERLFSSGEKGFFVEAGALDGEVLSNTLWLERKRNWTGLLIEPNEFSFQALKKRNRKSWIANSCLSTDSHPKQIVLGQVEPHFGVSIYI